MEDLLANRSLTSCPPWLLQEGRSLLDRARDGRLPHAILLTGIQGIGKRLFGQWLAEALLCLDRSDTGACGVCASCRQLLADSHPDFRKLVPEGANAAIKVEPIRALVEWFHLTAGQGSYRIALLEQADTLNRSAANGLLKTLEEPSDHAVMILTASRIGRLPATIRSRCQKTTLKLSNRPAAIAWLKPLVEDPETALVEAGGAPFTALTDSQDDRIAVRDKMLQAWHDLLLHKGSVGRISDSLSDLDTSLCLSTMSRWCVLSVKRQAMLPIQSDRAVEQVIYATSMQLSNENWFALHERLLRLHRSDSASFKTQTVLEGIFADIRAMTIV
jgi:DNA polymerase III subunit delta'